MWAVGHSGAACRIRAACRPAEHEGPGTQITQIWASRTVSQRSLSRSLQQTRSTGGRGSTGRFAMLSAPGSLGLL
jgi:hypothetical protein